MKHTIASTTKRARELAGDSPITESNYLQIAAEIYGRDGVDEEYEKAAIIRQFDEEEFVAWVDVMWALPKTSEVRRYCRQEDPPPHYADWLHLAVFAVLLWQMNAALMPLARAFAAQIEAQEEE